MFRFFKHQVLKIQRQPVECCHVHGVKLANTLGIDFLCQVMYVQTTLTIKNSPLYVNTLFTKFNRDAVNLRFMA